ncbi:MAG: CHASE2 domain-containing protein [Candidatus Obscuribacterales bacterium]|nr:CHASE2 domain-containing protein [Candidatus Obscuribacterales bacterium]
MRVALASIKRLFLPSMWIHGRDSLLFQRLFWGALAGCVATLLLAESSVLESMELSMLEWRYRVSQKIYSAVQRPAESRDISIIDFDDLSQFDIGIARFNDDHAQKVLATAIENIEKKGPAIIVIDLDLRGAANAELISVIRKYNNVVIGLFGSLEGSTDLPSRTIMNNVRAYGYDELIQENNGLICRLPVNYRDSLGDIDTSSISAAPVPSLTEAVINLHRQIKGVGPSTQILNFQSDQPAYINFRRIQYPSVSFRDVLESDFDGSKFKDRIVMIGCSFTKRKEEPFKRRTPLEDNVPDVVMHADAIQTLLDNQVIYSFPKNIAHHLLLLLGAAFGAVASILPLSTRTATYLTSGMVLVGTAQILFEGFHMALPVVPPLAVLTLGFSLGTFIYLDTDLRQRNKELAQARESMQVRAEEERQRIAEDLHDETLPALSAVARMADKLSNDLDDNPVPRQMREKLDQAVIEMRRVINDLHPSVLETMGFKSALENLLSILTRDHEIEGNFLDGDGHDDYQITNFTKLQLYRIVQEALNNVGKHSKASVVELKIEKVEHQLMIAVTDNGRGIDPKLIRKDSHGLLNIRQRAQLIGAQVEWKKPVKFPSGTELSLKINMDENPVKKVDAT